MKYSYAYKTSDGQRHEASMEARCREDVFAALRAQGIKAIKVVAADGSRANGEVRGVRKRVVAVGAVVISLVAGGVAFWLGRSPSGPLVRDGALGDRALPASAPRHQIYGDPAIVDEIERGKTEAWLTNRVDQLLAWFAQPGKLCCSKGVDLQLAAQEFEGEIKKVGGESRWTVELSIFLSEPREVCELKQMVNGLHEEMREYLANGNGTPRSYWRRLIQRTQQESLIFERTRRELEHETNPAVYEEKNQALRNLGLRTIPNPKDSE